MGCSTLLGGNALAVNLYLAVDGSHMVAVRPLEGAVPVPNSGSFNGLDSTLLVLDATYSTLSSVGGSNLVKRLIASAISVYPPQQPVYHAAPPLPARNVVVFAGIWILESRNLAFQNASPQSEK